MSRGMPERDREKVMEGLRRINEGEKKASLVRFLVYKFSMEYEEALLLVNNTINKLSDNFKSRDDLWKFLSALYESLTQESFDKIQNDEREIKKLYNQNLVAAGLGGGITTIISGKALRDELEKD